MERNKAKNWSTCTFLPLISVVIACTCHVECAETTFGADVQRVWRRQVVDEHAQNEQEDPIGSCENLNFVKRAFWAQEQQSEEGEEAPQQLQTFRHKPSRVFIHSLPAGESSCSAGNSFECSRFLQELRRHHVELKGLPEVAYNALIGRDGTVFEGVGMRRRGNHTRNYNDDSLGFALIGSSLNERMASSLAALLKCSVGLSYLAPNYTLHGHLDATCTSCPGSTVYAALRRSFAHFRPGPLGRYSCEPQQVDFEGGHSTRRERLESAAIGKSADKQVILLNSPAAAAPQGGGLQPSLYLLKTARVSPAAAALLVAAAAGGSSSSGGGSSSSSGAGGGVSSGAGDGGGSSRSGSGSSSRSGNSSRTSGGDGGDSFGNGENNRTNGSPARQTSGNSAPSDAANFGADETAN